MSEMRGGIVASPESKVQSLRSISANIECSDFEHSRAWSVLRSKSKEGPVYPLRLVWDEKVSALRVTSEILNGIFSHDKHYTAFSHFSIHPVKS